MKFLMKIICLFKDHDWVECGVADNNLAQRFGFEYHSKYSHLEKFCARCGEEVTRKDMH